MFSFHVFQFVCFTILLSALPHLLLGWQVLVEVLHARWHDLGERELDVLLVLVLVRNQNQFFQELECVLALVDGRVLDADLQKPFALVQLVDVRFGLGRGPADLDQVLQNLVNLRHDLPVLLIELEQLDEQLQLILVNVDYLHLVGDNVLGILLAVFLRLVLHELLLHLPRDLEQLVHVEQNHLDYRHGCRVEIQVVNALAFSFGLLRRRRSLPRQL